MTKDGIPTALKMASIGGELAFSVIAGALIGYFIGKSLGDKWFAICLAFGVFLGFAGGIYRIYQIMNKVKNMET